MIEALCRAEFNKACKYVFPSGIDRFEANLRSLQASDLATREDVYGKVQRDCARMK